MSLKKSKTARRQARNKVVFSMSGNLGFRLAAEILKWTELMFTPGFISVTEIYVSTAFFAFVNLSQSFLENQKNEQQNSFDNVPL